MFDQKLHILCPECDKNTITICNHRASISKNWSQSSPPTGEDIIISCNDSNCVGLWDAVHKKMSKTKLQTWLLHAGITLSGECAACLDDMYILDKWVMGHDVAYSKNGTTVPSNMRPTHITCNHKMGTATFNEYHKKRGTIMQ